jgi:insulysin
MDYLSNVIGHEGENSLLSYLKAEDFALALSCSPDHSMDGLTTFEIEITLTKKGLENYETVIEAIYQYLKELKRKGPSEIFFKDQKDVGEMNFMFADKKDGIDEAVSFTRKLPIMSNTIVTELIRSDYITDVFAPA